MSFINPLELLEINSQEYNPSLIKKQKRKLFAEFALTEEKALAYYGRKVTRADVEKVIDELDEPKYHLYYRIKMLPGLNSFLAAGSATLIEQVAKLEIPAGDELIEFTAPFYAEQCDSLLCKYLIELDIHKVEILSAMPWLENKDATTAVYPKTYSYLKGKLAELEQIYTQILNKSLTNDDELVTGLLDKIDQDFYHELINPLPNHFCNIRTDIAQKIRNLSVEVNNKLNNDQLSLSIMQRASNLAVDELQKDNFTKDYHRIKTIHDEKILKEQHAVDIGRCKQILDNLKNYYDISENNQSDYAGIKNALETLETGINPDYINSLSAFFEDWKRQIVINLRNLSISLCNTRKDINLALLVIILAKKLTVTDQELIQLVNKDYDTINAINEQTKKRGKPIKRAPVLYTVNGCGLKIYGDTLYFVFLFIPLWPLSRYSLEYAGSGYRFFGKLELKNWQKIWKYGLGIGLALLILIRLLGN